METAGERHSVRRSENEGIAWKRLPLTTLVAALVFAAIGSFAKHPVRVFRLVSAVVLVISSAMPLTLPAPAVMIASLEVMHVVAWAVIVGILTTFARNGEKIWTR